MGKQYFLGLEAVFKGSGNPAYPGETPGQALPDACFLACSAACTVACRHLQGRSGCNRMLVYARLRDLLGLAIQSCQSTVRACSGATTIMWATCC